jgi:hypothetical protein
MAEDMESANGHYGQVVPLKSPYPYFGGKATIAPVIWQALGACQH